MTGQVYLFNKVPPTLKLNYITYSQRSVCLPFFNVNRDFVCFLFVCLFVFLYTLLDV